MKNYLLFALGAVLAGAISAAIFVDPTMDTRDRYLGYVYSAQFEEVQALCEKNDGLDRAFYSFSNTDKTGGNPLMAYCANGARFDVPEEIQGMSKRKIPNK